MPIHIKSVAVVHCVWIKSGQQNKLQEFREKDLSVLSVVLDMQTLKQTNKSWHIILQTGNDINLTNVWICHWNIKFLTQKL